MLQYLRNLFSKQESQAKTGSGSKVPVQRRTSPSGDYPPARLYCKTGEMAGAEFTFKGEATVGRHPANAIVIPRKVISGQHAVIFFNESAGSYYIEDLNSQNGTTVDGVPVTEVTRLSKLNVISFAREYEFIFQRITVGDVQSPPAVQTPPAPPVPHAAPPASSGTAVAERTRLEAEYSPPPALPNTPPAPQQPSAPPVDTSTGPLEGTRLEADFGALPAAFPQTPTPPAAPPPPPAPAAPAPPAAHAPPATPPAPPAPPQPGAPSTDTTTANPLEGTRLEADFGALPSAFPQTPAPQAPAPPPVEPPGPPAAPPPSIIPPPRPEVSDATGPLEGTRLDAEFTPPSALPPPPRPPIPSIDPFEGTQAEEKFTPPAPPPPHTPAPEPPRPPAPPPPPAEPIDASMQETVFMSAPLKRVYHALIIRSTDGTERRFDLNPGENFIGRLNTCEITLNQPDVSRKHAVVTVDGERVTIQDLGSKNGTYIDQIQVTEVHEITPDHKVRIGQLHEAHLIVE